MYCFFWLCYRLEERQTPQISVLLTFWSKYLLPIKLFFFFFLLGPHLLHMEVLRLGVESELQLPATATAMQDPSCVCDLHHSSWQHWIPDSLSKARDRTCILMDTSQIHFCCATTGTPITHWSLVESLKIGTWIPAGGQEVTCSSGSSWFRERRKQRSTTKDEIPSPNASS